MSTTDTRAAFEKRFGPNDSFAWRDENDNYKVASLQSAWEVWQAATEAANGIGLAAPNEPKPCRACDPSVGFICEEHGESGSEAEADAYNYACELMEQGWKERAERGVEIGTEGSLCDGIAWIFDRMKKLEAEAAKATGTAGEVQIDLTAIVKRLEDAVRHMDSYGYVGIGRPGVQSVINDISGALKRAARQPAPAIQQESIDTPEFREILAEWYNAVGGSYEDEWDKRIVAHINAWHEANKAAAVAKTEKKANYWQEEAGNIARQLSKCQATLEDWKERTERAEAALAAEATAPAQDLSAAILALPLPETSLSARVAGFTHMVYGVQHMRDLLKAAAALASSANALSAGDRVDALRYRFLRDHGVPETDAEIENALTVYQGVGQSGLLPDELDSAIDAAILQSQKDGHG